MDNKLSNSDIAHLAEKYKMGNLSKEEQAKFDQWYAGFEDATFVHSGAADPLGVRERIYSSLWERMETTAPPRKSRIWSRIAVAASIAIAVMTGGYFFYQSQSDKYKTELATVNDIAPGKDGATLTLANGKKIYINDAIAGNIATQSGVRISKTADGEIIYDVIPDNSKILTYNTLSTTRGEQTRVRLPDGTLVFLNAESSLKYPTTFAGSAKRAVVLSGEGYFEVSKDKAHPFEVSTADQIVQVLGTHFNINAYSNSDATRTTLLEGSVRVDNLNSNKSQLLVPGQQAKVGNNTIDVLAVDIEDVVAWKEGSFSYQAEPLENIMKDVSRWYNVEVVFDDPSLKKIPFDVIVSRFDKVSKLLSLLQRTSDAAFEIKGNTILVKKKNN